MPDTNPLLAQIQDTTSMSPEKVTETKNYNFTIQAGAFMNVENAKNLCESLKKEMYFTEITTREIGGSLLNVVNVGKFETEKDAHPVLRILESKYNLKGRIVKLSE
jgi:cell division septation protein DedD